MRIAILGYSGSGKSTLASYLANLYDIPVLYLDTVQFEPEWKPRDREEAVAMVAEFLRNDSWVIDGNYSAFLQEERLAMADSIILMTFSTWDCLLRVYRRYFYYRNRTRESMAEGCNEKIDLEFIWWILYKCRKPEKQKFYARVLNMYSDKTIVLKNQKQLDLYKQSLSGHK